MLEQEPLSVKRLFLNIFNGKSLCVLEKLDSYYYQVYALFTCDISTMSDRQFCFKWAKGFINFSTLDKEL